MSPSQLIEIDKTRKLINLWKRSSRTGAFDPKSRAGRKTAKRLRRLDTMRQSVISGYSLKQTETIRLDLYRIPLEVFELRVCVFLAIVTVCWLYQDFARGVLFRNALSCLLAAGLVFFVFWIIRFFRLKKSIRERRTAHHAKN